MQSQELLINLLAALGGIGVGSFSFWLFHRTKLGNYQAIAQTVLKKAELEAQSIRRAAELVVKQNHVDQQRELEGVWQSERRKMHREEDRLKQREDKARIPNEPGRKKTIGHRKARSYPDSP